MHEAVKDLLINIFFIIGPLFLYQVFWSEKDKIFIKRNSKVIIACTSISMILCMIFPYTMYGKYLFDLRQIPFILGLIYGGYRVGFVLFVIIMIVRSFIGFDQGLLINGINLVILIIFVPLIRNWYANINIYYKSFVSSFISIMSLIFNIAVGNLFFGDNWGDSLIVWLSFILIQGSTMWCVTYMIETIKNNLLIKEELVRSEKSKLVGQLAAAISHEVRNPLTVTRGFIQLLKVRDFAEGKRQEFLEMAIKELDHAEGIITDYLTFAKPTLANIEDIDVGVQLERAIGVIKPYANERSVKITASISDGYIIKADKQRLHQCFINLTKNSIEAMPHGGEMNIKLGRKGKKVEIEISDNGIGMNNNQLERIGEPYFSTKEKGTGLGMMVVTSLIKTMNGKMEIYSEEGKGTKIVLIFTGVNEKRG